jgi:hypothetical protein
VRAGYLPVELFGEGLQVDIGGIDVFEELPARCFADLPGCDGDRFDAEFMAGDGSINGIFHENDGVIIGKCHAAAVQLPGDTGDGRGAGAIRQRVNFAGFADIPVLAEFACKVAACGTEGQYRRARQKMIQGLFFNRIDTVAAGSAVGREDNLSVAVFPYKAKSRLSLMQLTGTRTQVTHDAAVIQSMPVFRRGNTRLMACCGLLVRCLFHESIVKPLGIDPELPGTARLRHPASFQVSYSTVTFLREVFSTFGSVSSSTPSLNVALAFPPSTVCGRATVLWYSP